MRHNIPFSEDQALKRFSHVPADQKPTFNWSQLLDDQTLNCPDLTLEFEGAEKNFELHHVAEIIGSALTDLLLSREEKDIFTEKNQHLVLELVKEVANFLEEKMESSSTKFLSQHDLNLFIEKILVENDAHDLAKSLVSNRSKFTKAAHPEMQVRLIRRNGQVVPWNPSKIEIAIRKSFLSLKLDSEPAVKLAKKVTRKVEELSQAFVNIEDVQDLVQETLMSEGHYKVAEAYILYRAHRALMRTSEDDQDTPSAHQDSMILVQDQDGQSYFWDGSELRKRIEFASIGLNLCLSPEQIETELRRSLYAEMSRSDLKKTIILNAKSLIERDADFAKFSARILLSYIYEEVLGWNILKDGIDQLKSFHRKHFKKYLKRCVAIERLAPGMLELDLNKLSNAIDYSADLDFDYLGIQTLYDRYLIIDKTGKSPVRLETPQLFWMRVAMGIFYKDGPGSEDAIIQLYKLYKSRRFCSSTPTLFNAGTHRSQLSSCYLYKVDDSIESIMYRGIAENAFLSKWAGGLGGSWTAVRGTGGYIHGTNGESQGVIPFLKLHNDQLVAVNQGGKRRGAGCAYLEVWHSDFLDFLELRRNTGDDRRRAHDMNTAAWIPDLFMKRMEARENWTLFNSGQTPDLHEIYGQAFEKQYLHYEKLAQEGKIYSQSIPAIELWKKMLSMLFETGHPWITFKDPCNVRSPQDHVGVIHSSNLCTEITLNTNHEETAVCNLGSVILDTHLDAQGNIDHKKLKETIQTAVRALDNVIDVNFYPTQAAETSNKRHRPIGLGVMGLQNALYIKDIPFASQEAVEFNDEFMEAIAYYAYEASSDLAKERGTYSSYKGSKWDRGLFPQDTLQLLENERSADIPVPKSEKMNWKPLREKIAQQGMRNSNVIAIAPTATISNIMGTSPCIEPSYKNLFVKSNLSGDFIVLNAHLVRDLKAEGLWSSQMLDQLKYFDGELHSINNIPDHLKQKYTTAFDIDYTFFIEAAARRQKWIDQSQSVNLFLKQPNLKTLSHMYRLAWKMGLKTTYYLRTLGASNIEKATIAIKKEMRGIISNAAKKDYSEAERQACSLDAMLNGGECEACQ